MFSDRMNDLMYKLRPLRDLNIFGGNALDGLDRAEADRVISEAEHLLRRDIPMPTLNDMVKRPETATEKLRAVLASLISLALASVLTGSDRYTEKAGDLIYDLMEKSVWSVPDGKVPGAYPCITDVMAADTAETLAWASYLMRRWLNVRYPGLTQRIETEINYRVTERLMNRDENELYLKRQDGFSVAVLSRIMTTALLNDTDDRRRWATVRQILLLLDVSLRRMPQDGGSIGGLEGWLQEAVPLADALTVLYHASNRELDLRGDPRLKPMAEYPVNAHMGKGIFANPNGSSEPFVPGSALFRFGENTVCKPLMSLGAYINREFPDRDEITATGRVLALLDRRALMREAAIMPERPGSIMRVTQLAAARGEGFACALHGGSFGSRRADAGDVLITYHGRPVLADLGAEARSSEMHSLPQIGEFSVQKGHGGASDFDTRFEQTYAQLSIDLKNAFLADSGVISWERTVMLSRFEKSVRIVEAFDLAHPAEKVVFRMVTADKPAAADNGYRIGELMMRWEGSLTCLVESMLTGYRMTFTADKPGKSANYSFVFTAAQ